MDVVGRVDNALLAGSVNGRKPPAALKRRSRRTRTVPWQSDRATALPCLPSVSMTTAMVKGVTPHLYGSIPLQVMTRLHGIHRHHPMFIRQAAFRSTQLPLMATPSPSLRMERCVMFPAVRGGSMVRNAWSLPLMRIMMVVEQAVSGRNQVEVVLPAVVQQAIRTFRLYAADGFPVKPPARVRLVTTFRVDAIPDERDAVQPVTQVIALADDAEQCHGTLQSECRFDGIAYAS